MAINRTQSVFKYITVKCPLHRIPALIKLLFFLPLCIFCLVLPPLYLLTGIAAAIILKFFFSFSVQDQLTDLRPAVLYAILMYSLSVLSSIIDNMGTFQLMEMVILSLIPKSEFVRITLRLVLTVQFSALLFRTTSSLEIREALRTIEKRLLLIIPFTGKKLSSKSRLADNVSMFLSFIPEIFISWSNINLAWKARNGKQGIRKIKTTVFVLITVSMEKAALKSKAIEARSYRQ